MASRLFPNVAAKVSTSTETRSCNKHMPLSFTIFNLKHFRRFSELWIQEDGDFSIDGHLDCSLGWNTRELQHSIEASPNNSAFDIYEMPQKANCRPIFPTSLRNRLSTRNISIGDWEEPLSFVKPSRLIIHKSLKRLCQALVLSLIIIALTN